jgi:aryl-alcohol dehydrogenase-like predicted oxidoreductase
MSLIRKIALGTAQFGLDYGISNQVGQTAEQEVVQLLNLAHQHKLSLLDTAQVYGNSEEVIGRNHQERFDLVTKINPNPSQSSAKMLVEVPYTGFFFTAQIVPLLILKHTKNC